MKVQASKSQASTFSSHAQWNTPNKPVNYLWAVESAFWICERGQNLVVDWAVELAVAVKQPVAERPFEHCWCSSAATPLLMTTRPLPLEAVCSGCEHIKRQMLLASSCDKKTCFLTGVAFILWAYLRNKRVIVHI